MTASDEAKKALEGVFLPTMFPLDACVWFRKSTGEWVLEIEGRINDTSMCVRHPQPGDLSPEDVPALPALLAEIAAKDAEIARLRESLAHTADQALAHEIPVGYGPEDKGAWTKGYDAAIRHARRALKGDTYE